jgi:hypothetical protein
MNRVAVNILAEKIKRFAESPEGKQAIKEAINDAREAKKRFEEATRLNPGNLYKPMDI